MSTINTNTYIARLQFSYEEEVSYKECCRNHATAIGAASYDGCSEYLSAHINSEDTFLCGCCGCHRNYHRKHIVFKFPLQAEIQVSRRIQVEYNDPINRVPVADLFHLRPATNPEPLQVRRPRKKRTTFSPDQRNQMIRFADLVGWKPNKGNKADIDRFCADMGITRRMFIVWLSNNRHRATKNMPPQN